MKPDLHHFGGFHGGGGGGHHHSFGGSHHHHHHHRHHHHHHRSQPDSPSFMVLWWGNFWGYRSRTEGGNAHSGGEGCLCCPFLRYIVMVLALVGCTLETLLRYNISVAIVAMTLTNGSSSATSDQTHKESEYVACPAAVNASKGTSPSTSDVPFNWSLLQQGIVLGTFFWGYLFTKVPGGRIADRLGGPLVVGAGIGLAGVLCLLCPLSASLHPYALAAVRLVMGLLLGATWPALYSVLIDWATPGLLATMVAATFSGQVLGMLLSLGCMSWVVEALGWRWVFYVSGIMALVWTPLWFLVVRDDPKRHPCIAPSERELLKEVNIQTRKCVPWGRVARCPSIYILALVEFALMWFLSFIVVQGPTLLVNQIGFSLHTTSMVMLIVTATAAVACYIYGTITDFIFRHQLLSKLSTRRLTHAFGMVLMLGGTAGLMVTACDGLTWVLAMLVVSGCAASTSTSTYQVSPMDLAPNYASTITGLSGVGQIGGFLAPIINAHLINTRHGLLVVVGLAGLVYCLAGLVYVVGVEAEVQEWNDYQHLPGDSQFREPRGPHTASSSSVEKGKTEGVEEA